MKLKFTLASILAVSLSGCGLLGSDPVPVEFDTLIRGVNYVGVSVSDIDATEAYYAAALETQNVFADTLDTENAFSQLAGTPSSVETRLLRRTNSQLRLMEFSNPSERSKSTPPVSVQGPGIAHVCFQVDKATHAYERILDAGAEHMGDRELVHLNPRNPVYYGYVKDKDGIITEVEEVDVTALDLPAPPTNQYRIRHVSLATPNLGRLKDFYSAFLGDQEARHIGKRIKISSERIDSVNGLTGSKVEMAWLQLRNLEIEMFQYHSHETEVPEEPRPIEAVGYNMIVFDVSDIEAAGERLIQSGGTLVTEAMALDGGQIIFGRDPDKNLIGLQTLPSGSVFSAENFKNNGME